MYSKELYSEQYDAFAALTAHSFVKLTDDKTVTLASADDDAMIGICVNIVSTANLGVKQTRVIMLGVAQLKLGATVTRGEYITSDSSGLGTPSVETNDERCPAMALRSGVSGDIIPVLMIHSKNLGA